MSAASFLTWAFAVLAAAVAPYHLARIVVSLRRRRHRELDVDLTHTLMGLAMAAMLAGSLTGWPGESGLAVFALATAWFGWRSAVVWVMAGTRGLGHPLRQTAACFAMSYMLFVSAGAGLWSLVGPGTRTSGPQLPEMRMSGRASLPGTGFPLLAILLIMSVGVTVWTGAATVRAARGPGRGRRGGVLSPALTAGCQTAMSATTVYMLAMMA